MPGTKPTATRVPLGEPNSDCSGASISLLVYHIFLKNAMLMKIRILENKFVLSRKNVIFTPEIALIKKTVSQYVSCPVYWTLDVI